MTDKRYYKYWGKAGKEDGSYHLLPYHCLDVAAVGYVLLNRLPRLRNYVDADCFATQSPVKVPVESLLMRLV